MAKLNVFLFRLLLLRTKDLYLINYNELARI